MPIAYARLGEGGKRTYAERVARSGTLPWLVPMSVICLSNEPIGTRPAVSPSLAPELTRGQLDAPPPYDAACRSLPAESWPAKLPLLAAWLRRSLRLRVRSPP